MRPFIELLQSCFLFSVVHYRYDITRFYVECHTPCFAPLQKSVQIILQAVTVGLGSDFIALGSHQ